MEAFRKNYPGGSNFLVTPMTSPPVAKTLESHWLVAA
jgi:hypothetical protein